METGEEVSNATLRHLRSTFPFDSKTSVSFVSGGSQEGLRTVIPNRESSSTRNSEGKLTGSEAKEFYEEVISLPEKKENVGKSDSAVIVESRHSKQEPQKTKKDIRKNQNTSVKTPITSLQLFKYVQNNELEPLQTALLEEHFDVNTEDNFHWTMLMVAAYAGHTPIVEYLLEMGAKWREYTHGGMNAADLARTRGYQEIADLIESSECEDHHYGEQEGTPLSSSSSEKRASDKAGSKPKRGRTFYCKACEMFVSSSHGEIHSTSIVHLYNDQCGTPTVTCYGIPESNRGFQMLLRSGWDRDKGLGPQRQGHRFPVKTVLKQDRLGLGLGEGKARVTHFSAHDKKAIHSHRDRYKKAKPSKKKKDILQEKQKDSKWERRLRTLMNIEDSHLLT